MSSAIIPAIRLGHLEILAEAYRVKEETNFHWQIAVLSVSFHMAR